MTYPFSDDYTFAIMNDQNVSVELENFQKLLNLPATRPLMSWNGLTTLAHYVWGVAWLSLTSSHGALKPNIMLSVCGLALPNKLAWCP